MASSSQDRPDSMEPQPSAKRKSKPSEKALNKDTQPPKKKAKQAGKAATQPPQNQTEETTPRLSSPTQSEDDIQEIPPEIPSAHRSYGHRLAFPYRASNNCAADHPTFKNSAALVYHYLEMEGAILDEEGHLVSCHMRCAFCVKAGALTSGWKWNAKTQRSTSNFLKHMRTSHQVTWESLMSKDEAILNPGSVEENKDAGSGTLPKMFAQNFSWDTFYEKMAKWMVVSNQPFTEVENEEFRDLLGYLKGFVKEKLVGADQMAKKIEKEAAKGRERLKELLKNVPGKVPLACDAWTSSNRIAFLAIIGSFITKDWELVEVLIDFVELKGSHSGENMGNAAFSSIEALEIIKLFLTLTADNASNNGTLITTLTQLIQEHFPKEDWDAKRALIRCLSHIIHLAVMELLLGVGAVKSGDIRKFDDAVDDVETEEEAEAIVADDNIEGEEDDDAIGVDHTVDLSSAIQKVRKIAKLARSSPQRMEDFHKVVLRREEAKARRNKAYSPKSPRVLILDVITRWNSTFFMLKRALEYRDAIDELCVSPHLKIYIAYKLSPEEWQVVETVAKWLEFFRQATAFMSGQKYPTLSSSLQTYAVLLDHVKTLETSNEAAFLLRLGGAITACKEKLLKFFDKSTFESEYYYFATILDPRFKDGLFTANPDLFDKDWVDGCRDSFLHVLELDYSESKTSESGPSNTRPATPEELDPSPFRAKSAFASAIQKSLGAEKGKGDSRSTPTQELQRYLNEDRIRLDESPLAWWRKEECRFPCLARMARDYLAIPGSSVSVERAFNIGRDVISLRRNSLKADTVRNLMLLRSQYLLEKRLGNRM